MLSEGSDHVMPRLWLPRQIDRVSFGLLSMAEYERLAKSEPHMPRSRFKLAIRAPLHAALSIPPLHRKAPLSADSISSLRPASLPPHCSLFFSLPSSLHRNSSLHPPSLLRHRSCLLLESYANRPFPATTTPPHTITFTPHSSHTFIPLHSRLFPTSHPHSTLRSLRGERRALPRLRVRTPRHHNRPHHPGLPVPGATQARLRAGCYISVEG